MRLKRLLVSIVPSLLFTLSIVAAAYALESLPAKVVGVTDGDTINAVINGQQIRIRLYGIDAPEKSQAFGQVSTEALKQLTTGHKVTLQPIDRDRYGRTVALVFADGVNVNEAMVKDGNAWVYPQYCTQSFCNDWRKLQQVTQAAQAGLWQDANPTDPWEWRHGGSKEPAPMKLAANVYHGNVRSHKFHSAGCQHYDCPNCTKTFATREQAISAGYAPCKICNP